MSYTLAFWSGGDDLEPEQVYLEGVIEGVRPIDVEQIERAMTDNLPGWTRLDNILNPPGVEAGAAPVFEVHFGERIAEFIGYGIEDTDHFNAIIDVMHPLGFRLYDPQTRERFG